MTDTAKHDGKFEPLAGKDNYGVYVSDPTGKRKAITVPGTPIHDLLIKGSKFLN